MTSITHHEVRRHPRWREELGTPIHSAPIRPVNRWRLLLIVGGLIVAVVALVLLVT